MKVFWRDLRYGARLLGKSPGFTLVAMLTLALGIGANTAVFTIVNAVIWRTWPGVAEPERLVRVRSRTQLFSAISFPDYLDLRERTTSFSGLTAHRGTALDLRGPSSAERIQGALVSDNYFAVLGVSAAAGRVFATGESEPVAIVSYACWERRFGRDPRLTGSLLTLNGSSFTVIGITTPAFQPESWGRPIEIWLPVAAWSRVVHEFPAVPRERGSPWFDVLGRLKAGVTIEQAGAEMQVLGRRLPQVDANKGRQIYVTQASGLGSASRDDVGFFGLLMIVVALLLLIACANVANLLLARAAARRREIAVRLALGAGRMRLIRQLLTESVLLSMLGAAVGLLAAWRCAGLVLLLLPPGLTLDLAVDKRVLGFTMLVAVATAVVFGLAPALLTSRPDLVPALKETTGVGQGFRRNPLRGLLVVSQVALSLVLLIAAGLFIRTLANARKVDFGFDAGRILFLSVDLGNRGYSQTQGRLFYQQLLDRLAGMPGISSVSLSTAMPYGGHGVRHILLEGRDPPRGQRWIEVDSSTVSPAHLANLSVRLVQGREFRRQDSPGVPGVVMVNVTAARLFWPGENPIGKRLRLADFPSPFLEVVGVARDTLHRQIGESHRPLLYLPLQQHYESEVILHVRGAMDAASLAIPVRAAVRDLDPNLPLFDAGTFAQYLNGELLEMRVTAILVGVFAALAVLLASVGLYGVISYAVSQRTHEIGVRIALGAERRDVLRLVVRDGMLLSSAGVAIGLGIAAALMRLVSSRLYGVKPGDPLIFLSAPVLLTVVALLAILVPARRATNVDPIVALRHE